VFAFLRVLSVLVYASAKSWCGCGSWSWCQGAGKKKSRGPPWWVCGSEHEKGIGPDLFSRHFFIVFLNSPYREAPKNVINKTEKKSVLDFWSNFLSKFFDTMFFVKRFCVCFELPSLRNTRKRDKTKKNRGKTDIEILSIFLEKVFDMGFWQKYVHGVFELPLPRNVQKRTEQN
jgi:hypothetical protein